MEIIPLGLNRRIENRGIQAQVAVLSAPRVRPQNSMGPPCRVVFCHALCPSRGRVVKEQKEELQIVSSGEEEGSALPPSTTRMLSHGVAAFAD